MSIKSKKILIVISRFYAEISASLEKECIETIKSYGFDYDVIDVPGAFEVPAVISHASKSNKYIGYVALGCVIRGETSHYDYVCTESSRAIMKLSLEGLAIGYGILTCENKEQALARSNFNGLNKGKAATLACIRMIEVLKGSDK
ncbi:MAG: 6,7-dimethyl-8-ribityllumazine synthase [Pelagibacterales bacterium]|jgi:6,7-dimethyl-8-ribityllumazine synthase|nr:6,7-dimethyl-8-ribityllumazine synthase [Pelagibacterales bacterium]